MMNDRRAWQPRSFLRVTMFSLMLCMVASDRASGEPPRELAHFDAMPKPVLLPDGRLAAYFLEHSGPGLSDTPETQHVTVRYSANGGETWSAPQRLFTLPSEAGYFGYGVPLIDRDGEAHLFLLGDANTGTVRLRTDDGPGPRVEPLARQSLDVWHVRSTDQHQNWSEPRMIWRGRAGDLQSATQLSSGRIVLPLSYYVDRNWGRRGEDFDTFTYKGQFDVTALYSDDDGKTWHKSEDVLNVPTPNLSAYGAVEPVVIELDDSRVWMMIRTQLGRFYESFSPDGASWSPARPSAIFSSDSPSALMRTADKRIVMLWNNCLRYPYAQGARNVLHAAISSDDGQTWRGYREILRDPRRDAPPPPSGDHGVSYPYATLTGDGRSVVYSLWVESDDGRGIHAFDLDWLEETSQRDNFEHGLDGWSTFGTRGVEVVPHSETDDGAVLQIAKTDASWPAAAVWNFPAGTKGQVRIRLMLEPQDQAPNKAGGYLLILTDHFSVPFDDQDKFFSLFNLAIGADGRLPGGNILPIGEWMDLTLDWDCQTQQCRVSVGDRLLATLPQQRAAPNVSYLRLRSTAEETNSTGLLIDHVETQVSSQ